MREIGRSYSPVYLCNLHPQALCVSFSLGNGCHEIRELVVGDML